MAIEIREKFEVNAPIDRVWQFVMDPHKVVACMPGASLDEVIDDRHYAGSVKVKVGAVTATYKGTVEFKTIDEAGHRIELFAEGKETGGGTAKGTITSVLRPLDGNRTEVVAEARVDLTGRIMQVGRRMIEGVAHQLFLQFVKAARAGMEAPEQPAAAEQAPAGATTASAPAPVAQQPIRIVPLLLRTVWDGILGLLRRLFGRR
ncbi:MAG: carbon monoxide dehydrogenase [Candidatus Dadabacteria bacterium]|nr:MAG: carbon monoxide dehydrogenase [Candidatus Dadabacteria bacterium]